MTVTARIVTNVMREMVRSSMAIVSFVEFYQRALIWARDVAISSLPRRASIPMFHPPAIMIWIGPVYSEPVHFSSALLRISGMFMAGIAGIVNVRRTWASGTGLPEASISE